MSPFIMYSSQNPWNFLDMEVVVVVVVVGDSQHCCWES